MRVLKAAICLAFGMASAVSGAAAATYTTGSATASIPVSATVIASCTITASSITIGNYAAGTTAATTLTGTVTPTCTNTTPYEITMSDGSTGTEAQRLMTDTGGDTLNYNIYSDAAFTTIWGDGTSGTAPTGTGTGAAVATSYYVNVPAAQYVTPGAYSDTVTVTVAW
jgi:spore coat protein U-like protein